MPGVGVEPTRCRAPKDFKSFASTNFATRAAGASFLTLMPELGQESSVAIVSR